MTNDMNDLPDEIAIIEFLISENDSLKKELDYQRKRSDRWEKIALAAYQQLCTLIRETSGEDFEI